MDYTLLLTVGIIFATTLVGSFLRGRARDRCLGDFDGFMVILNRTTQQNIWGVLHLEASGFELRYDADHIDTRQAHIETSYIVYKGEYASLKALHRNLDRLTENNRRERDRAAKRSFHPSILAHANRTLRNFTNSAAGSLNEITALLVGRSKLVTSQAMMVQGQTHLMGMTKEVIGYVGTTYDPLLEQLIGIRVVFEISEDNIWHEHVGILKEYSGDFLLLLDVFHLESVDLILTPPAVSNATEAASISVLDGAGLARATLENKRILVENLCGRPLIIRAIVRDDAERSVQTLVGPGLQWEHLTDQDASQWIIRLEVVHHCDIILPRAHAIVRHRAERYDHTKALGVSLKQRTNPEEQPGEPCFQIQGAPHCDCVLAQWLYWARYESEEAANERLPEIMLMHPVEDQETFAAG